MAGFAVLTTLVGFGIVNAVVEELEERGRLDTHRPDDAVSMVQEDLFQEEYDHWISTPYSLHTMVPSRFRRDKGPRGWRMFVAGGSFAMGSPYVDQVHRKQDEGGIATWLRRDLEARSEAPVEIVNVAAGAQNSHRVAAIAEAVLPFDPDVLFVATCNNEGALPPGRVRQQLHKLGGYRLLARHLAPSPAPSERSYFTPQDADTAALAQTFRANLERIVKAARGQGVPVLLATLPVNLMYEGTVDGRGLDPTVLPAPTPRSACIQAGIDLARAARHDDAIAQFRSCEELADGLRWAGLSMVAQGDLLEGRAALEQSVELRPRNRCRPSFNAIIRDVAGAHAGVHLVDLDAASRAHAPAGQLPGYDQFLDFCHMHWRGYAAMAQEVLSVLERDGLTPPSRAPASDPLDVEGIAAELRLDEVRVQRD